MFRDFRFSVNGEIFEGYVISVLEPKVGIYDNKSKKIVMRTIRFDSDNNSFFTWNGKTCFINESLDGFEIEVR